MYMCPVCSSVVTMSRTANPAQVNASGFITPGAVYGTRAAADRSTEKSYLYCKGISENETTVHL